MNFKRLFIGFSILLVAFFLLLEGPYLYQHIKYRISKPVVLENMAGEPSNQPQIIAKPNMLTIPSLGIAAPIKYVEGEANEEVYQKMLQEGVVHYPGTADIGQPGNAYIFGHSSDFAFKGGDYKTVFALLPNIKNGAEIMVTDKQGKQYSYVVTNQFVAEKTDVHLLDQNGYIKKQLSLQTSYPLGTALKRYIVIAELRE